MLASKSDAMEYNGMTWNILVLFIAGLLFYFLIFNFSPIVRVALGYPLIAVFPALFLFLCFQGQRADLNRALISAILAGPVFSGLIIMLSLLLGRNMTEAIFLVFGIAFSLAIISIVRGQEWSFPGLGRQWLPVLAFLGIITLLVVLPLTRTIQMRLSFHGWFHASVAYQILNSGIPLEEPLFPGGRLHNYWFYHTWLAGLTQALRRPPSDIFVLINLHALVSVILGVWACGTELFKKRRARMIALVCAILGMNALGFIALLKYMAAGGTISHLQEPNPSYLMRHMVLLGNQKLSHSLGKFMHANAFPLGMSLYVACLYFALRILKKGPDRSLILSLTLSTLGVFLFHPTTGLGLGLAMFGGWLLIMPKLYRTSRRTLFLFTLAPCIGATVSIPYLLSIFPSQTESIGIRFSGIDFFQTLVAYLLMVPFLIWGSRYFFRKSNVGSIFLLGFLFGTFSASVIYSLPGPNQYKFVLLLAIPAGLIAGAGFSGDRTSILKKSLLVVFLLFALINLVVFEYAYLSSGWARTEKFTAEGINIEPLNQIPGEREAYRWIRKNCPKNSILINGENNPDTLLFAQRSMIPVYTSVTSRGHQEAEKRIKMVHRLYSIEPFKQKDITFLRQFNRPVYIMLSSAMTWGVVLVTKFDNYPEYFKPVYYKHGYRIYYLVGSGELSIEVK